MPGSHSQSHLVLRLLAGSLMIGMLFSMIGSGYFLRQRYLGEIDRIDQTVETFVSAQLPGINLSAFTLDYPLLQEQMAGALRLPGIYWIAYQPANSDSVISRSRGKDLTLYLKRYPLRMETNGRVFALGDLELGVSYISARENLQAQIYEVLWQTSLFVLGTALGITLLLHRGLIRHLRDLRHYLDISAHASQPPFVLQRAFRGSPDELDDLVDALNTRNQTIRSLLDDERRLRKQLFERQAHLDRMLYALSHDLRQPLFTMDGCISEIAAEVRQLQDERLEDIPPLLALVKHANQTISHRIAALSRLFRIRNRDTLLECVDGESLRALAKSAVPKGYEAAFLFKQLPACKADRTVLFDVFGELFMNCAQYASPVRPLHVCVQGRISSPWAEILVEDNGIGMSPIELEKLDILFYKSNPSSPGVGIGIATGRILMESIGGEMHFTTRPDGGFKVQLKIPLPESPVPPFRAPPGPKTDPHQVSADGTP